MNFCPEVNNKGRKKYLSDGDDDMTDKRYIAAGIFAAALVVTLAAGGAGQAGQPAEPAIAVSEPAEEKQEELRFIVREQGGTVCVFREGFDVQPAIVTEISVEDLPAADRALLEAGMEVAGREALLRLLEDLGS
jgi:hypothetical protein